MVDVLGLSDADKADLAACLQVIAELMNRPEGTWYDYTSNRAGTVGRGTVHGGSRFWKDPEIAPRAPGTS